MVKILAEKGLLGRLSAGRRLECCGAATEGGCKEVKLVSLRQQAALARGAQKGQQGAARNSAESYHHAKTLIRRSLYLRTPCVALSLNRGYARVFLRQANGTRTTKPCDSAWHVLYLAPPRESAVFHRCGKCCGNSASSLDAGRHPFGRTCEEQVIHSRRLQVKI